MGNILSSNSTSETSGTNLNLEVWANWLPALVVVVMLISVSILSSKLTDHVTTFCTNAGAERCKPAPKDPEAAKAEAAKVEAARVEAAKVEAAKVEAAKVEAARVEAARVEAARKAKLQPNK